MKMASKDGGWKFEDFAEVREAMGNLMASEKADENKVFLSVAFAADGAIALSFSDGDFGILRDPSNPLSYDQEKAA